MKTVKKSAIAICEALKMKTQPKTLLSTISLRALRKALEKTLGIGTLVLGISAPTWALDLTTSTHSEAGNKENKTMPQSSDDAHKNHHAQTNPPSSLATLKNFQQNASFMFSSGLPDAEQLAQLKGKGVTHVIDLIPGNRADEIITTSELGLDYFNVPVDWEGPTLANFLNYAAFMKSVDSEEEKVLTHCKLNWRGAAFTYLYRVNVLGESEKTAKKDLMAIWHPNPTWFAFMNDVISHYNAVNNTQVAMSFEAALPENH